MSWYDTFASFYDTALEGLYRSMRVQTVERASLSPGARVLDLACGTGQNFAPIMEAIGPTGHLGVDFSAGMLKRARARVERSGWANITLVEEDARELTAQHVGSLDAIVCTLGLSVIPEWESVFDATFALLQPGGRYTIFDVHAERWVPQTTIVQLFAQAKLDRKVWTRLEGSADEFTLDYLPVSAHIHGGRVFIASGLRNT